MKNILRGDEHLCAVRPFARVQVAVVHRKMAAGNLHAEPMSSVNPCCRVAQLDDKSIGLVRDERLKSQFGIPSMPRITPVASGIATPSGDTSTSFTTQSASTVFAATCSSTLG